MKAKLLLGVIASALVLAGCSATPEECDPSKELGLFGKMACVNSGSYQQRIDTKNTELQNELDSNYQLHTERQHTHAEQSKIKQQVSGKQSQLNSLNKSVSQNQAALKSKQKMAANLNKQIAQTKQQISKVQSNPSLSATEKNAELKRLQDVLRQREAEAAAAAGF